MTLCERFKELMDDFCANPKNPKIATITDDEAKTLGTHRRTCDTCDSALDEIGDTDLSDLEPEDLVRMVESFVRLDVEDETEKNTRERMIQEVDTQDQKDEKVIENFLITHSELAPEKFGISLTCCRLWSVFFAVNGIEMLIGRYPRDPSVSFRLDSDGTISSQDGTKCIPATATQQEVAWMMHRERCKEHYSKVRDVETAKKLIVWMIAAITVRPNLMKYFTGTLVVGSNPPALLLVRKEKYDEHSLVGWE